MEIIDIITQLISNVGFPIAAFVMMWIQNIKTNKVIGELKETVDQNTIAIKELSDRYK